MPSQIKVDEIKNVAGQYKIKTDTLEGQANTATNAKLHTDSTVESEGGVATTKVSQGLVKAWVIEDHDTSNEIKDSFNVSSTTDTTTGVSQFFYTNNMVGSENAPISGMSSGVYNGACNMPSLNGGDDGFSLATTYWYHSTRGNGGASGANTGINLYDCERVVSGMLGDLA